MIHKDLKFGTSGLRGLAVELDGPPAFIYSLAFGRVLLRRGDVAAGGRVLLGRDLRPSSPAIARRCAAGLRAAGLAPVDCGTLPTPALAAHALRLGVPAVMVTGSHIPEDRNGLKFYRPDGEIGKDDEAAITAAAGAAQPVDAGRDDGATETDETALALYRSRGIGMLPPGALSGMRIGVYQHSTVARDLLVDVLAALGATTIALGRTDGFVPVDTEALRPEDEALALQWAGRHRLDAIVSADGDADRPLIFDEAGRFLRGDLVGAATAHVLGADCVVTPVSSNSGIERCGRFPAVLRTRIGSPYVIEGIRRAAEGGARRIVGFEANGGVLVGSDVDLGGRILPALPTRDALVPVLAVLSAARGTGRALSALPGEFLFSAAASGRLSNVDPVAGLRFLDRLLADGAFRARVAEGALDVAAVDPTDGVRMESGDGTVLHYRASGNAPELRCYVEATNEDAARALLALGLGRAESCLREQASA